MTTSTDLRERASEQERLTANQLTTTGLTLVSAGFTLYPTRMENGRRVVLGVGAPKLDDHKPQLVVHKESIVGKIPKWIKLDPQPDIREFHDLHFLNVAGFDLSSDGPKGPGATAINFGMIPDFDSFSSGLQLASDWQKRLASWAAFDEGQLVAVPDEYSLEQTCEWTDFATPPQHHTQTLTSQTAYSQLAQRPRSLVLTSRSEPTKRVSLELRDGPVFAAFVNFAVRADAADYAIDFEHINTMFRLCDKTGEVRFTLGEMKKRSSPILERLDKDWPKWLTTLVHKNNYFVGRPHCGARQMRAPAA